MISNHIIDRSRTGPRNPRRVAATTAERAEYSLGYLDGWRDRTDRFRALPLWRRVAIAVIGGIER